MMNNILNVIDKIVVNHEAFLDGMNNLNYYFKLKKDGCEQPIGIALIGESGMGKTTLIKKFIEQHAIIESDTQTYTPIALVRMPTRPKGNSLCNAILEGLGDKVSSSRVDIHQKVTRIAYLLNKCQTVALVLDEMQHFVNRWNGRDAHDAGDTLKLILDLSNVMLVCSGLEYGASLFKQNEQLMRRFSRAIKLSRFDWDDAASRTQFKAMLKAIQVAMEPYFKTVDLYSNEMAFRLYVASGGITGYAKAIIVEAAQRVYYRNQTEISLKDYAEAYSVMEFALTFQGSKSNPFTQEVNISNLASMLRESKMIGVANIDKPKKKSGPGKRLLKGEFD